MSINKILTFFFTIIFASQSIFANVILEEKPSIFDELNYQEMVEITMELDMEAVVENRRNTEKHPVNLSFQNKNGEFQNWNIKVELRGKFRRTKCEEMPPLKLNFKKKELEAAGLSKFDDMKMVTHCVADKKEAKQLLAKEYIAYKLYNQLTEESFRVQFLQVNFKDSKTGETKKQFGILIEDTAQLRNRIAAKKTKETINLPRERFDEEKIKMVTVFQYMIGNSDWAINREHNLKILEKDGKKIAVPYDFDFSGLVSASYVRFNPDLGITSPTDRVYLGFEDDLADLDETLLIFSNNKNTIIQTIKDCKLLNGKNRRGMVRYINSFYKNMDEINVPTARPKPPTLGD